MSDQRDPIDSCCALGGRDLRVPAEPPLGRRAGIDLFDAIGTTRSIRRFRPDTVPADDLATMLFAATRAPTGSNRQPVRWIVLRDGSDTAEPRRLLGEAARHMWKGKRDQDGYSAVATDADTPKARMATTMDEFVDSFEQVPVIVLPVLMRYREALLSEGGSVYPAVQNLMLAARGLGYGGVITMFHAFADERLAEALGLPDNAEIAATIALGRPVGGHGPLRRRPLSDIVYEGTWGESAPWAVEPTLPADAPAVRP